MCPSSTPRSLINQQLPRSPKHCFPHKLVVSTPSSPHLAQLLQAAARAWMEWRAVDTEPGLLALQHAVLPPCSYASYAMRAQQSHPVGTDSKRCKEAFSECAGAKAHSIGLGRDEHDHVLAHALLRQLRELAARVAQRRRLVDLPLIRRLRTCRGVSAETVSGGAGQHMRWASHGAHVRVG